MTSSLGRAWLGVTSTASVYVAIAMTFGGIAGFASHFFGADPWVWFAFGMCVGTGPLYFYYTSCASIRTMLVRIKGWADEGLITSAQHDRLRDRVLRWFGNRRFGIEVEEREPTPVVAPQVDAVK